MFSYESRAHEIVTGACRGVVSGQAAPLLPMVGNVLPLPACRDRKKEFPGLLLSVLVIFFVASGSHRTGVLVIDPFLQLFSHLKKRQLL